MELLLDTALVVGLLHFKEPKRDAVDKDSDIRAERALRFRAEGQLINDGEIIGFRMGEINELDICGLVQQTSQELFAHIIVLDDVMDLFDLCQNLFLSQVLPPVDTLNRGNKAIQKNSGFRMYLSIF